MDLISTEKYRKNLEIRWTDIDEYGMVNNVHYLNYFQEARHWYFAQIGWDWSKDALVVLKHEIFYKIPISRYEKVYVITHATEIRTSSFTLEYEIYNDKNEVACYGSSVIVAYDKFLQKSHAIDQKYIDNIELFEEKKVTKK